jgi:hypothetical protein
VRHAGDERLVRDAFLKRLDLDVSQIAGRKADIYLPILYAVARAASFSRASSALVATD